MNNKILRQQKIDERYILSERKFLYTFGYLCLEDELINNEIMTKKQLYYFLNQRLNHASEIEVNLENVVTGKIILVGRTNNFHAYYRPTSIISNYKTKESLSKNTLQEFSISRNNTINEMQLSKLLEFYYDNILDDDSIIYLEEILLRSNTERIKEPLKPRKYKTKMKCYKRNCN